MLKIAGLTVQQGSNLKYDIHDLVSVVGRATDNIRNGERIFIPIPLEFELVGNPLETDVNGGGIYLNLRIRKE